jgi:hypothetical protein
MSLKAALCAKLATELEGLARRLRQAQSDTTLQAVALRLDAIHNTLQLARSCASEVDEARPST